MKKWQVQTLGWLLLALLGLELRSPTWLGQAAPKPEAHLVSASYVGDDYTGGTAAQLPAPDTISPAEGLAFARHVLALLEQGDPAAINMLAWETLHIAGHDVGLSFRDIGDQAAFQAEFIQGVSSVFAESENPVAHIQGWRIQARMPTQIVIAAELPSQVTIMLTVIVRDHQLLLEGIEFSRDEATIIT